MIDDTDGSGYDAWKAEQAILRPPAATIKPTTVLATQVGGNHYKRHKIQPIEYITANNLGFIEGNIIKYATRHADKGGRDDVLKIIHYAELLLQLKYDEKP